MYAFKNKIKSIKNYFGKKLISITKFIELVVGNISPFSKLSLMFQFIEFIIIMIWLIFF